MVTDWSHGSNSTDSGPRVRGVPLTLLALASAIAPDPAKLFDSCPIVWSVDRFLGGNEVIDGGHLDGDVGVDEPQVHSGAVESAVVNAFVVADQHVRKHVDRSCVGLHVDEAVLDLRRMGVGLYSTCGGISCHRIGARRRTSFSSVEFVESIDKSNEVDGVLVHDDVAVPGCKVDTVRN